MADRLRALLLLVLVPASQMGAREFMLCLHQDGSAAIEDFDPSCCRGGCESGDADCDCCPKPESRCPDRDCKDVPLVMASISVSPKIDVFSADLKAVDFVGCVPIDATPDRPATGSTLLDVADAGPPRIGPAGHLTSVVRLI